MNEYAADSEQFAVYRLIFLSSVLLVLQWKYWTRQDSLPTIRMLDIDDEAPPDLIDAQVDETNDHGPGLLRKVPISIITGRVKLLGLHISRIRTLSMLLSHTTGRIFLAKIENDSS